MDFCRPRNSCFRQDFSCEAGRMTSRKRRPAMFGLPTRKDFDDVTRQLTEARGPRAQPSGARPEDRMRTMSDQENQASRFARDMAANAEKILKATQLIANTRDEDVAIGTTPKHLVMRRDKVELFHYEPMAEATAKTPVLLAYGLIGRYTMADLQPDRSLVRSLLAKGLDLWLIDWGQPSRAE